MVKVIPVIDVRHGVAVRAVAGDRQTYRPLETPLATSPGPEAIAAGLMALHTFPVIYVADLDGIEGRGADRSLASRIAATASSRAEVWIDSGATALEERAISAEAPTIRDVLGSESGWTPASLGALTRMQRSRIVLSLDFRGDEFIGDPGLLSSPECWPDRVVVMTLGRVGRSQGPDLDRLSDILGRAQGRPGVTEVYAAGGVRGRDDLSNLDRLGVAGALVSSALHAQTITANDLEEIAGRHT